MPKANGKEIYIYDHKGRLIKYKKYDLDGKLIKLNVFAYHKSLKKPD